DELRINPGWSTSMLCTDSMEVEELLRDVMANPVQVEVGGDIMLWRSSDTELTFRSSPTPPETPWQIRERESNILGVWLLESYRTAAGLQHIEIGVNAAEQPWVEVDDATISGSAGCNGFGTAGDGYRFDGETLSVDEGYLTASLCVGDDGTDVMQAETALRDLLWQIPSEITVKVRGDSMTWSAGGVELRFFRTTAPPGPPTTQPPQSFGKLDCSPGHVDRVVIDDTTRDAEQILRDEVPKVVRTEEDREFTDPSPEGWFWLGYDAQDNPIAFIARGDIEPPKYELFTCSEQ
ncbi:MAG: hypothetical protein GY722_24390, partial [bacterium]|nr:hypothetical protein [bacterium]